MVLAPAQVLLHEDGSTYITQVEVSVALPEDSVQIFFSRVEMVYPWDRAVEHLSKPLGTQIGVEFVKERAAVGYGYMYIHNQSAVGEPEVRY